MTTGTLQFVQTCSVAVTPCPEGSHSLVQAYLIGPLYQVPTDTVLGQSGIDWTAVGDAFGMSLFLFAVGSGCGILLNVVRKFRV